MKLSKLADLEDQALVVIHTVLGASVPITGGWGLRNGLELFMISYGKCLYICIYFFNFLIVPFSRLRDTCLKHTVP